MQFYLCVQFYAIAEQKLVWYALRACIIQYRRETDFDMRISCFSIWFSCLFCFSSFLESFVSLDCCYRNASRNVHWIYLVQVALSIWIGLDWLQSPLWVIARGKRKHIQYNTVVPNANNDNIIMSFKMYLFQIFEYMNIPWIKFVCVCVCVKKWYFLSVPHYLRH